MSYSNVSAAITAAQNTAISNAFGTINANMPFLVHLNPDERQALSKMGPQGYFFVTSALMYAASNPSIVAGYMNLTEAQKDLALNNTLRNYFMIAASLLEGITDTMMATGTEAKQFADDFYAAVQRASAGNVVGSTAVYEALRPFYEHAAAEEAGTEETSG